MSRTRTGGALLIGLLWLLSPGGSAHAQPGPAKQPAPKSAPGKTAAAKPAGKPGKKPGRKPAKGGGESKKPARKAGSEPKLADPQVRSAIAGQPVTETDSPELKGLREADDALFFDLLTPVAPAPAPERPEVVATGLPSAPQVSPPPELSPEVGDVKWMAGLKTPDLPFRWDVRLVRYLDYFKNSPKGRNFVASLLKRSGRYEAKLREALKKKGLPEDLVYLALCESGMNPRIVSHAGAAGLWQFMPKAGEAYGLRIDRWVDERLDPERSTEAAIRYLSDLNSRFGRWELAMAAYNMGHGGLLTSIRKYNTNDFWELSQLEAGVPYETALYVPKIVAVAFVAKNREAFGIQNLELDPPEKFETAVVGPSVSLEAVASATKTDTATLAAMNPQLLDATTPPASDAKTTFAIRVPEGAKTPELSKLATAAPGEVERHIVRWGESLEVIAADVGLTEAKLRSLNGFKDTVPPRPGTVVLVPKRSAVGGRPVPVDPPVVVVPARTTEHPGKERVFYEVVWGDSLDDVARVLGVTSDDLVLWNNLDRTAKLHGKMILQAFVAPGATRGDVRTIAPAQAKVLVVGSPEFFDYFEAKNNRSRVVVTVKAGDTMRALAKRYGTSLGMLERINHRSRDAELTVGDTLVVYTPKGNAAAAAAAVAAPKPGAEVDLYDRSDDTTGDDD